MLNRRQALGAGALGVGASVVLGTGGAFAQPVPVRRRIHELALDDPIVATYRDGVRILKSRNNGRVNWASIAAIHGTATGFNRCPHGNWYFLPWHRAFILMYERIIRDVTRQPQFALPYWDWARDREMPPHFTDATYKGQPNPLFEPNRFVARGQRLADTVSGERIMQQIMGERDFELFGSGRPTDQSSTEQRWISEGGVQGPLERTPHNLVHVFVGGRRNNVSGLMASSRSALDPVFWLHHCNIDRIWSQWNRAGNQNTENELWRNMTFEGHFLAPNGTAYSARVSELLETDSLGYSYTLPAQVAQRRPPENTLARAYEVAAAKGVSRESGIADLDAAIFRTVAPGTAAPNAPLSVRVPIPQQVVDKAFARGTTVVPVAPPREADDAAKRATDIMRGPTSGGAEPPRAAPAPVTAARAPDGERRVIAVIRDMKVQSDTAVVRVFLESDGASGGQDVDGPNYVGTIALFGALTSHAHGAGHRAQSAALDLTEALTRQVVQGRATDGAIRLKLVSEAAFPNDPGTSLTPGSVEIVFL